MTRPSFRLRFFPVLVLAIGLLALSALINIGDPASLERVVSEGARQSEVVQRATNRSLVAFYLDQYPELAERAHSRKEITLQAVRQAESVRMRGIEKG
jgi:predicted component of type VI protein secretion system